MSFLTVSVWWALFTVPLLLGVRERAALAAGGANLRGSFRRLGETLGRIRENRNLWLFLLAYWLYIDGVATIIRMAVDYGLAIGLPSESLITALLIVQFVGFPATLAFGRIATRFGAKRGLWIGLWVYVVGDGLRDVHGHRRSSSTRSPSCSGSCRAACSRSAAPCSAA